ncbi:hypothetical protein LTR82_008781 [Friedmanniomyces endolithicus]|uniref:Major facilitator superfamily (MFS) profile domain-containing protein n=1 Tax=Friedmanniomyces endolithicus TaxID=329885 RepID=A0AAN6FMQ8_9PEZI|nr:hypothetical protein LTR82_008781 [Friedmanniomyces endolithicus]
MAAFEKGAALTIEDEQSKENAQAVDLKLDKNGLPLVPQPSAHSDDPLNWSPALKLSVALQVSWLSFLGPMSSAVANPAFIPIGKAFHITTVEASYSLTMYIIFAAGSAACEHLWTTPGLPRWKPGCWHLQHSWRL